MVDELALAAVPLIHHRGLRVARQYETRFAVHLEEVDVSVSVPGMERLVRVKAVTVPAVQAGGSGFGAVDYSKVPVPFNLESLYEVGFTDTSGVDVLDFDKTQWSFLPSDNNNNRRL